MLSKEQRSTLRHNIMLGSSIGNRVVVNDLLDTCDELEEQKDRLCNYFDQWKSELAKRQELEQQLADAEAAGAAMRQSVEADVALIDSKWVGLAEGLALSHGYTMSPSESALAIKALQLRESALATDIGKTTLARIEQLEAALQSCRDQFAFTEQEVGWRKRLQDEIDEALKGATE